LRAGSTNTLLLHAFAENAPAGSELEVYGGLGNLPLFSPDLEAKTPQSVLHLAHRIDISDGLLIACPEYAHGIPGPFKNAIDWLVSRYEIPGKPVMLVHASTRGEYVRAHLHEVLKTISCRVYPGPEFETHLIGKNPERVSEILGSEDMRAVMRSKLQEFEGFIALET
jgi:chromate reductase, NAD(P)H dehydrogenase (quinone)